MADEQAFADFVRRRAATLYRYGYVLAGNHHDADDLVTKIGWMNQSETGDASCDPALHYAFFY